MRFLFLKVFSFFFGLNLSFVAYANAEALVCTSSTGAEVQVDFKRNQIDITGDENLARVVVQTLDVSPDRNNQYILNLTLPSTYCADAVCIRVSSPIPQRLEVRISSPADEEFIFFSEYTCQGIEAKPLSRRCLEQREF